MEIFKIDNFSFTYPNCEKPLLSNISLSINSGDFCVVCGRSGSGKSTLLKNLKSAISPFGKRTGNIFFKNKNIKDMTEEEQAFKIGFVFQNPENQIVTDKVWHELAFGLENMGISQEIMQVRISETANFFGIQNWFDKDVSKLSGGQKQILSLASVMVMQPEILILDEPTSQLDPISAADFFDILHKLNNDLGITIILSEQRLDEAIPLCDKLVVLEKGKVIADGKAEGVIKYLYKEKNEMFYSMPVPAKIFSELNYEKIPLTVRDGRKELENTFNEKKVVLEEDGREINENKNISLEIKNAWFKYDINSSDVLKNLNLKVESESIYSVLGGNGSGKSTMLSLLCGINKPYKGKIFIGNKDIKKSEKKVLMLPQNPLHIFVKKTVRLDLEESVAFKNKNELNENIDSISKKLDILDLLDKHPYDLSGGEVQRAALAKVLLRKPDILLLDEPTKGLDSFFKLKLGELLKELKKQGMTIVLVSHDIEFCAIYSDKCSMFFDGRIVGESNVKDFFCGNNFYTTMANRMARNIFERAVTAEDVIDLCKKSLI